MIAEIDNLNEMGLNIDVLGAQNPEILPISQGEDSEDFETNWESEVDEFDNMGLKEELLIGIYDNGLFDPLPIQ